MYENHFGLKKRPFRALAIGHDVFIGPQTAGAIAGLKKALTAPDAVVAVGGPVGGGKTTVVGRALDGIGKNHVAIPVGRIKLGHDEVLELLLEELGVQELPLGTVQRFTLFRRMLKDFAAADKQVFVVVEDAVRIGADSLSELEALTAADSGVSDGANLVLMGGPELDELLSSPGLARLKQRIRLRKSIAPLTASELLAYFKHCFRLAGGDFDSLFAEGSAELIHKLSDGIPRMANNIVESALTAAAEESQKRVSVAQISKVAEQEYGLKSAASGPVPVASETRAPAPAPSAAPKPAPPPAPKEQPQSASQPVPPAKSPDEAKPAFEPEATADITVTAEDDIPELIQDTLPDLEVLAPQLAREPEPQAAFTNDIPTLTETNADNSLDEVPAWERDPTLAELRPDLEALEHAMAVAQGIEKDPDEQIPVARVADKPADQAEAVPEITLDREIQAKIEEAAEAIKRTEAEAAAKAAADAEAEETIDLAETGEIAIELPPLKTATPEARTPAKPAETRPAKKAPAAQAPASKAPPQPAANTTAPPPAPPDVATKSGNGGPGEDTEELQKIAANLSRAKTIDDVDDRMAETLFGEEFSEIAAQVAAKAAAELPANDELELELETSVSEPAPVAEFDRAAAVSVNPGTNENTPAPTLDEAASRRLATVRALNGAPNAAPPPPRSAESIVMTDTTMTSQPPPNGEQPQPIEDQINTSMTQTLKALNVRSAAEHDDDDEKKGFFSRFRRS